MPMDATIRMRVLLRSWTDMRPCKCSAAAMPVLLSLRKISVRVDHLRRNHTRRHVGIALQQIDGLLDIFESYMAKGHPLGPVSMTVLLHHVDLMRNRLGIRVGPELHEIVESFFR